MQVGADVRRFNDLCVAACRETLEKEEADLKAELDKESE